MTIFVIVMLFLTLLLPLTHDLCPLFKMTLYSTSYAYEDNQTERDRLIADLMYKFLRYTHYKLPALENAPYISICIIGSNTLYNELKKIGSRSHQGRII